MPSDRATGGEASGADAQALERERELEGVDVTEVHLPEAAGRRLAGGAWTSALSVSDFAACEQLGMEPLGFVQGYSVMQWAWYSTMSPGFSTWGPTRRDQYSEQWRCPHGFVSAEHRAYGINLEQTWIEDTWGEGWGRAFGRMLDEARELGAHGVVGVTSDMRPLVGSGIEEFSVRGTAVAVPDAPLPDPPFSTFLAGQRLAKLIEAGFAPVSVVATLSSVLMYANCITLYQLTGRSTWGGGLSGVQSIEQVGRAQQAARELARRRVLLELGGDALHGASLDVSEREAGEGSVAIQCHLRGTRVRRFKDFDPLPAPGPVVRLS